MHYEIRLSGIGGQGLGLGGKVFAEAVGARYNVTVTQNYDFRARGGESTTDLIVSDTEIYFPTLTKIDFLLAMGGSALDISVNMLNREGVAIFDSDIINAKCLEGPGFKNLKKMPFPLTRLAREKIGSEVTATVIGLGVLGHITRLVPEDMLRQAVENRSPASAAEKNLRALEIGFGLI